MAGSCRYLREWGEGALFVEVLLGLEAVVELSEEAVEQVTLDVAVLASAPVVGVGSGRVLEDRCAPDPTRGRRRPPPPRFPSHAAVTVGRAWTRSGLCRLAC